MAGSVILAGARTPIGKLSGSLAGLLGRPARRHRHQGRARARRPHAGPGRLRLHGPGAPGRRRPDPARQAAVDAGIPMSVPVDDGQQGVPVGPERDLPRRPDDPGGRGRDRRGRRHGVDDAGAAPAPGQPAGLQVRRRHPRRLDVLRRPVLRLRPGRHGRRHREVRRLGGLDRAPAGRARRARATSGPPRPPRTGCSTTRSPRCRSPSARATRSCSTPTRASAPTPPPSRFGALRPAFDKAGNITAGNASQISDGGAAVIVTSKAVAERLGIATARRDRRLRPDRRARPVAAHPAVAGHQGGAREGRQAGVGPLAVRAQRGLRRRRPGVDGRPRHQRRHRQRQRRRHRPRPPRRHERHPGRAHAAPRAQAPRGGGLGAAALCGGGGQGDAILLSVA